MRLFKGLVANFGNMMSSVGAAGKVFEFLDRQPAISSAGKLKPDRLRGNISFKHLNFAYPSRPDKTVLQVSCGLKVTRLLILRVKICTFVS